MPTYRIRMKSDDPRSAPEFDHKIEAIDMADAKETANILASQWKTRILYISEYVCSCGQPAEHFYRECGSLPDKLYCTPCARKEPQHVRDRLMGIGVVDGTVWPKDSNVPQNDS